VQGAGGEGKNNSENHQNSITIKTIKKRLLPLLIIALAVSGLQAQDAASKIGINRTWISLNSEPEKAMDSLFQINDSPVIVPSSLKTFDYATSSYEKDSLHSKYAHRIGIYAELGGNGGGISGNIEYSLIFKKILGIYLRGGMGNTIVFGEGKILIESGFLIGKGNNYFDVGLGYTFDSTGPNKYYFNTLRLGYRYQGKKGFIFRLAPLLLWTDESYDDNYGFWFGISLGYSFQLNK
jgi:hypothetical protein